MLVNSGGQSGQAGLRMCVFTTIAKVVVVKPLLSIGG